MSASAAPQSWQPGAPSTASAAAEDIARRIAAIISLGYGLLLAVGLVSEVAELWTAPVWWRTVSTLVAVASVAVLVGHRAPRAAIRVGWAIYPLLWALTSTAWTVFGPATMPGTSIIPWTWALAPLAISIAALRWGLEPAVVIGVAPVLAVPAVAALTGSLSAGIASLTALGLGTPIFAVLVAAARDHLFRSWQLARELAGQQQAALLEQAWRDEHDRLTALVHDEVLGTLGAAGRSGPNSAELVVAAQRSVALLAEPEEGTREAATVLRGELRALALANHFEFTVVGGSEIIRFPADVCEAVLAAAAQAARNSVEHAGGAAVTRRLQALIGPGRIEVDVLDDGQGFDPAVVPGSRLGLRTSVVGRMRALPGGSASVASAPGRGTRVRICWRAESQPDPAGRPVDGRTEAELPDIGTVAGVTTGVARTILLACWAAGLFWLVLAWPQLPHPELVVAAFGWLLGCVLLVTRPSPQLPLASTFVLALAPAVSAACLLAQWSQLRPEEVWLLQFGADIAALVAVRGRVWAASAGLLLAGSVTLPLAGRLGQLDAGAALLAAPTIGVIAGGLLARGLARSMQANLAFRDAEAQVRAVQQAARDAAARADRLRADVAMLGLPSLTALARGDAVDAHLAGDCLTAAAAIRDLLRAPTLATGSLARACAAARRRGVQVRLLDDSPGLRTLSDRTLGLLTDAVDSAGGGRVTIRLLPPGRHIVVTAVLDDDGVRRLEFAE